MPFPSFNSVQEFTASAGGQIQQFTAYLNGFLQTQHKDDGSHGAITADSLTLTGNVTNTQPAPANAPFTIGTSGATGIKFTTNGVVRWGINAAGDLTVGPSGYIVDAVGTPTLVSGGGTGAAISGRDSAFLILCGSAATANALVVTFGHPFQLTPMCSLASSDNVPLYLTAASGSGITIARIDGAIFTFNSRVYVTAHGTSI